MEKQFALTSIDKKTVTYDIGGGEFPCESSFYAAGYGDYIAVEHHTLKYFGVRLIPVSAVTVNGVTFATDAEAVEAINALDVWVEKNLGGLDELIPATASATNQLADKDFVNSSINAVAAHRVSFDAEGNGFPTKADLLAATVFYRGGVEYTPTTHDYCIVIADESAPAPFTGGQTRYEFDSGSWAYVYGINEEPFTAAENAAIDSGITAEKVAEYDAALSGGGSGGFMSGMYANTGGVDVYNDGDVRIRVSQSGAVGIYNVGEATLYITGRVRLFTTTATSTPSAAIGTSIAPGASYSIAALTTTQLESTAMLIIADSTDSSRYHEAFYLVRSSPSTGGSACTAMLFKTAAVFPSV